MNRRNSFEFLEKIKFIDKLQQADEQITGDFNEPVSNFINSGILQSYILGIATPEEKQEVERMSAAHPADLSAAIEKFSLEIENHHLANTIQPPASVKALVFATIDYGERMRNGEQPSYPPVLNQHSKLIDYAPWLERPDMVIAPDFDGMYAKIIGYSPAVTTAIVWVNGLPPETHENEIENFLIVEGTCDLTIGDKVYPLSPGDFLSIPLYEMHQATVTSAHPCKFILQRIAV